jgi:hypothetical protein
MIGWLAKLQKYTIHNIHIGTENKLHYKMIELLIMQRVN